MDSRCLSAAGLRLFGLRSPLRSCALLTSGLPAGPGLVGVSTLRTEEMRPGWMPPLLRNLGVRDAGIAGLRPWFSIAASAIFPRRASLPEPQQWLPCVHPSGLPLARHEPYGSALPWTLTPSSKAARYQATFGA